MIIHWQRRAVWLAIVVTWAGLEIFAAGAAEPLRWKLQTGERFRVEIGQFNKQIVEFQENKIETPHDTTFLMTWSVDAVDDDGTIHLTQVIDRITLTTNAPGQGKVTYDSAADEDPTGIAAMFAKVMGPLVGAKLVQTMNDRGENLEVNIPEEALAGFQGNPIAKQMISDDFIKEMYTKALPAFPEKSLEEGDDWSSSEVSQSPLGQMTFDNTYTYQGTEDREGRSLARIGVTTKVALAEGEASPLGALVKIKNQESSSVILFDSDAGYLVETRTVQKMNMSVNILGNDMDQKVESIQTFTLQPASGDDR